MKYYLYNNSKEASKFGNIGFVSKDQVRSRPLISLSEFAFAKEFDSALDAERFNKKLWHKCIIFGRFDE